MKDQARVSGTSWPLLGRDIELSTFQRCFDLGQRGVVFVGAAGTGKTRLAFECQKRAAERGFAAVQIAATEALSNLPLGQFATLLPDLGPGTPRTEALRQIAAAIHQRGEDRKVALLVDDLHLLDEASAALTLQLTASGDVFLIGTMQDAQNSPESVISLWKDEIVTRIDLRPLDEHVMEDLLDSILEGKLEAPARKQFLDRSAGNILFLRELLTAAVEQRVLVREGELWHLEGKLSTSTRLVGLVGARLKHLDDRERTALELVALGEPLGVGLFDNLVDPDTRQSLERKALLVGARDGRRLDLRLAHPMYAEVLRATLSPTKARSLYKALADALASAGARRQGDLLNLAMWRLEGGGAVEPAVMLKAAHRAWALNDLVLASDLAHVAVQAGGGFDAELFNAQLCAYSGKSEEAERLMEALAPRASDDVQRTRLATARIENLSLDVAQHEAAMIVADEVEKWVTDPACRDELAVFRTVLADMQGATAQLLAMADLSEHGTGRAQAWACIIVASGYTRVGRLRDALQVAERGFAVHSALSEPGLQWGPDMHTAEQAWIHALLGQLSDAEGIAGRAVARGEWISGWSLAITYLLQGKASLAERWARETAAIAQRNGQTLVRKLTLIQLVEALALSGQLQEAESVLAVLKGGSLGSARSFEAEVLRVHGWVELVRGDRGYAKSLFEQAASTAGETGDKIWEFVALYDLARVDTSAAGYARLADLGASIEGSLTSCRLAHIDALVRSDAEALAEASVQFEELGCLLLAAEAASASAQAWRRVGRQRLATLAERRMSELVRHCDGAVPPTMSTSLGRRSALAPRQLEIASLAARGIPNKAIAQRLGLSPRTVENRLHEVYSILGVEGRDELADRLESLEDAD